MNTLTYVTITCDSGHEFDWWVNLNTHMTRITKNGMMYHLNKDGTGRWWDANIPRAQRGPRARGSLKWRQKDEHSNA